MFNYIIIIIIENKYCGLTINEQEIVPIFDPTHLLKTIRYNLLIKDVVFIRNGQTYKTSWDRIKLNIGSI